MIQGVETEASPTSSQVRTKDKNQENIWSILNLNNHTNLFFFSIENGTYIRKNRRTRKSG